MRDIYSCPVRELLITAGVAAACLLGVPASSQVQEARPAITTPAGAPKNVYSAGAQIRTQAGVNGDFVAAGGKVVVEHPVAGDANLAGGSVDVRAPVGDDVRAMGGDITIDNKVTGEVFATGGNITLTRAASVGRGATFFGGNLTVEGRVDGDLKANVQKIIIDGDVRGNARLSGESIELGPHAHIGGALTYSSPSELTKADGAIVAGSVTREQDGGPPMRGNMRHSWQRSYSGPSWMGVVMSFLALLAVAALFILAVPRFGDDASRRIQSSPGLSLAIGFATAVAVPVLAMLLCITILGIPLGIALMALYPALLLMGFVIGVLFIARLLVRAMRKEPPSDFATSMGYFAMALLLMLLVGTLPFVGALALGLLGLAGIGACVMEMHSRRKGPHDGVQGENAPVPRPA